MSIRVGCQTYTWEMLGDCWAGSVDDILDAIAAAGYQGIEISNTVIGDYEDRPGECAEALTDRGLQLAAFAYARTGFSEPREEQSDRRGAQKAMAFARCFPEPLLALGGPASPNRKNYETDLDCAICFYKWVARQAQEQGLRVVVHPHSHHGSLVESGEEYARLLAATEDAGLQFNPDTGHIARGGQDVFACFQRHRSRIAHVHFKDVDAHGQWAPLGEGQLDFPRLVAFLRETDWEGWIIAEEESAAAWDDPSQAIRHNRDYLASLGL